MLNRTPVTTLILALAIVFSCANDDLPTLETALYAVTNPLDVKNINQVKSMNQKKYKGHNGCCATASCEVTNHFCLQPDSPDSNHEGYYVYTEYKGFSDKSGNAYDSDFAKDWDINAGTHPNKIPGAHGFIVEKKGPNWLAIDSNIEDYLRNHGLIVSTYDYDILKKIKYSIDNGLPLIAHIRIHYSYCNKYPPYYCGHCVVVTGYKTNAQGVMTDIVVNEPYGKATASGWPLDENAKNISYSLSNKNIEFSRVHTTWPIGIWGAYPGWMSEQPFCSESSQDDISQKFQSSWDQHLKSFGGEEIAPWDNGKGPYVHCWPDGNADYLGICNKHPNAVLVQDFLTPNGLWIQMVYNKFQKKAHPTFGSILTYWHDAIGYITFGPPRATEQYKWINGIKWTVQEFQSGWIGSCKSCNEVRMVFPTEFDDYVAPSNDDDDDDDLSIFGFQDDDEPDNNPPQSDPVEDPDDNGGEPEPDPVVTPPDTNSSPDLNSSPTLVECMISCPSFGGQQMNSIIWYGLNQHNTFSPNTKFTIPYKSLCQWEVPSFEFNCVLDDIWGYHKQADLACSDDFSLSEANQHTKVIFYNHNCNGNNEPVEDPDDIGGEPEPEPEPDPVVEPDPEPEPDPVIEPEPEPEPEPDPVLPGEKVSCTIDCPYNLDVIVWYGDEKSSVFGDNSAFWLDYCELCIWGEPAFEFNCTDLADIWDFHEEAIINCSASYNKSENNQHTRLKFYNFNCGTCP